MGKTRNQKTNCLDKAEVLQEKYFQNELNQRFIFSFGGRINKQGCSNNRDRNLYLGTCLIVSF